MQSQIQRQGEQTIAIQVDLCDKLNKNWFEFVGAPSSESKVKSS